MVAGRPGLDFYLRFLVAALVSAPYNVEKQDEVIHSGQLQSRKELVYIHIEYKARRG
jgi:hypothetical protein